ncbi:hypothetical protein ACFL5Q_00920 [Planctomycetota bacterium]
MTDAPPDDLHAAEKKKRDANWAAAERWHVLQQTITWAESQLTVNRNTPEKCLELRRAKLADGLR